MPWRFFRSAQRLAAHPRGQEGGRPEAVRPNDLVGVQLLVLHRRQKRGGGPAERGIAPAEPKKKNRRVAQGAPSTSSDGGRRARKRRAAARSSTSPRSRSWEAVSPRRFRARGRPKNPTRTTSGARRVQNVLGLSRKRPTERSEGGRLSVCSPVLDCGRVGWDAWVTAPRCPESRSDLGPNRRREERRRPHAYRLASALRRLDRKRLESEGPWERRTPRCRR